MPLHPRTCCGLYSISCLLDALDGYAARRFNQSTKFGAVLDMVTDRCTTACLLVFLASAFPRWSILFQGLIALDFASHYMHMYATLAMGDAGQSHKNIDEGRSWILKQYYSNNVGCLHSTYQRRMLIWNRKYSLPSACSTKSSSLRSTSSPSPRLCYHRLSSNLRLRVYNQAVQLRQSLHSCSRTRGLRELWSMRGKFATFIIQKTETMADSHHQSEQNGQHHPMDPRSSLLSRHVWQANHQRRTTEESQHVARRGRCESQESSKRSEEGLNQLQERLGYKDRSRTQHCAGIVNMDCLHNYGVRTVGRGRGGREARERDYGVNLPVYLAGRMWTTFWEAEFSLSSGMVISFSFSCLYSGRWFESSRALCFNHFAAVFFQDDWEEQVHPLI